MYKIKILFGRAIVFSLYSLIRLFSFLPTKKQKSSDNVVVLTGTFYSKNWINAHLVPLVTCSSIKHVYIVSSGIDYNIEGLSVIIPSPTLSKFIGSTLARLITFFVFSLSKKTDYIGGFHILFNATLSILFANIIRCRSIYFSVGGITETLEAGKTENSFFKFLDGKDDFLTRYICKIAANATYVITMGNGAKSFLSSNGVNHKKIHVISGAIDKNRFYPPSKAVDKKYDLVLTARLSKVKQVDLLLDILACLKKQNFSCNALVIGDGPLLTSLKQYAKTLAISHMVNFVGHQDDVLNWLQQSKIYILTSRSEGLALSMLEGLKVGLPAIVPNVGDLSDVLVDGFNGSLIENHSIDDFVQQIKSLLGNVQLLEKLSCNAIASTKRFDLECVQKQWDDVFIKGDD
ncbi:glycosyltransferase family 4 protein [Psychromonas antarctica]|uniref:glycosyltransferase family 4 protein n=1 Tax=Psychromonas antarctica TaxID=67573 RepID=UPI001EE8BC17|nr:glycosyltransferase family 4 protein [Psychromonas antarctica]MCG6201306.1 glycosyltransferase family 4 protein [Psychromonas antarctica]